MRNCISCGGSGYGDRHCPYCDGLGKHLCHCGDSAHVCGYCKGSGVIPCERCGGKGAFKIARRVKTFKVPVVPINKKKTLTRTITESNVLRYMVGSSPLLIKKGNI